MSNLCSLAFKLNAVSYCSASINLENVLKERNFLTYQMIKNIKLPGTFRRESSVSISYHFLALGI